MVRVFLLAAVAWAAALPLPAADSPALPENSIEPARAGGSSSASDPAAFPHARVKVAIPRIATPVAPDQRTVVPSPAAPPAVPFRIDPVPESPVPPDDDPEPFTVMAEYGDIVITDQDVIRELWERRGGETLDWLIGKAILERELSRLGLTVAREEIDLRLEQHLAGLRRAFPSHRRDEDLTRSASGMSLEEYRERTVWVELALRKIMDASLPPGDDQLRGYFAERQADFIQPEVVRMSQIFIAPRTDASGDGIAGSADWAVAENQIQEAHARLRKGEDFLTVARSYGAGGRQSYWVGRGELLRELEDAAFSLRPGSLSAPLKSGMGYHIIRCEEKRERQLPKFDDVRNEVRKQYEDKRFLLMAGEFMHQLRAKAVRDGGLVIHDIKEFRPAGSGSSGIPMSVADEGSTWPNNE